MLSARQNRWLQRFSSRPMPTANYPLPSHTISRSNGPLGLSSRRITAVRRRRRSEMDRSANGVDAAEGLYRNVSSRNPMNGPDPPRERTNGSVDVKRPLLTFAAQDGYIL